MENIIKQAEEERNKSLESAKRLHEDYIPLKDYIDKLRAEIGLQKLPDLHEEDLNLTSELVMYFFDPIIETK